MEIILNRDFFNEKCTLGKLYVDGKFECHTLEDFDRKVESGGVKISGKTAIPRGRYQVIISYSNRFKKTLPLIVNVPQFSGVRIHSGNFASETDGCVLVGNKRGDSCVSGSRIAMDRLMNIIELAEEEGEEIWIKIQ